MDTGFSRAVSTLTLGCLRRINHADASMKIQSWYPTSGSRQGDSWTKGVWHRLPLLKS